MHRSHPIVQQIQQEIHFVAMRTADETSSLLNRNQQSRDGIHCRKRWWVLVAVAISAVLGFSIAWSSGSSQAGVFQDAAGDTRPVYTLEMEGEKRKKKKKKNDDDGGGDDDATPCDDGGYSKRTLQMAYELPFASLFPDTKGNTKYEASSVIVVGDRAYAVCDSSWSISKFDVKLEPFSNSNVQVGDPKREEEDSGYEAIFYEDDAFYVVRESIKHEDKTYHAVIEKLTLGDTDYEVEEACSCEFEFEGDSKGFEGAVAVRDLNNEVVVLGLCEGNYCSEKHKDEAGNGRVIAMRRTVLDDGSCLWSTIREIKIPSSAYFRDYSAITVDRQNGRVAISSQEESQLWVGRLLGKTPTGLWNIDRIEFDDKTSSVYDFPKNDQCKTVYCNIEGVHWLPGKQDMIIAVSDKMKGKGKQDFRCFEKDQSVHVFVLPY